MGGVLSCCQVNRNIVPKAVFQHRNKVLLLAKQLSSALAGCEEVSERMICMPYIQQLSIQIAVVSMTQV